ncbi:TetR family transcriptional regulator [Streptomyces sp. A5-4]|uniref:TetR family transcriptional regulator n=1 Tax=Streptomyces sp. A5-4 TaxID=3384771 RepID=UPI003DA7EBB8
MVSAARTLFLERGYRRTTLRAVAGAAGATASSPAARKRRVPRPGFAPAHAVSLKRPALSAGRREPEHPGFQQTGASEPGPRKSGMAGAGLGQVARTCLPSGRDSASTRPASLSTMCRPNPPPRRNRARAAPAAGRRSRPSRPPALPGPRATAAATSRRCAGPRWRPVQ